MTVTGEKKRKKRPEKPTDYTLVYQNKNPNRVKTKINPKESDRKPKTERPVFIMEHRNLFESDDDTE